jgi:hypothetical protein
VDLEGEPKIKLSEDIAKLTIPGRKKVFRLYSKTGIPLVDLMSLVGEADPQPGVEILCRHPFDASKRAKVIPHRVELLHNIVGICQIHPPVISDLPFSVLAPESHPTAATAQPHSNQNTFAPVAGKPAKRPRSASEPHSL